MLLNIALILYVAVCLYLCLRNKKGTLPFRVAEGVSLRSPVRVERTQAKVVSS
nr:hypothetical protein [Escherichia coli]